MLNREEVKHIAKLARIDITPEELDRFTGQISGILEYVGVLDKLEILEPKTTYSWDDFKNSLREDVAVDCDRPVQQKIIDAAPEKQWGYVKVKSVF
ncbi:MAG: aspartyl-tRNA(Asn)/glutamyl-tRNA (Gln) amidotransferase subunit C [Parcubacteria group bacterium Gr01-1014_18]|nr:MAG: aspartyl-tRNA(Asn)/glutamyl-tRNA (Gln) amidotransferase subunit C [Parcubacteria group bacterium Greene0416_36]TSC80845.1 MAG: aspartyl-tRNA(Asn)/glutamyl-tRNA (Gln) amidotransferase subunit C [Parcubacteria group bacterium Gr01-1014_18]TSC99506.1 MAG: aspartyl-tRNA(Asn)/glutamyl-tRNA (Gln) amidotransferase subunit C [Parcubacteria group bacterium Greene1014_20]TSD07574.1 MAG: aspartyl-tRNA(Asn)/glutamyl-tRNA (Gln) amidotransferase subunit C [Parcubacteria group bacterium Greene0714_2]